MFKILSVLIVLWLLNAIVVVVRYDPDILLRTDYHELNFQQRVAIQPLVQLMKFISYIIRKINQMTP